MLVRSTEKIKEFTGINKNMSWDTIKAFVLQAEIKYVKPVLGDALYAALNQAIDTNDFTAEQTALLEFVYPMATNLAMYLAAPQLAIQMSDMGFMQVSSKDGTATPASTPKYNDARLSLWKTGDDYREFAYAYLQANQSAFSDWTSSTAYSVYSSLFIRNSSELNEYLGMGNSVSTFLTLKPHIKLCEDKYILPIICTALAADIKTKNKENTLSVTEADLLDRIKNAVAWLALYEAAPTLKAIIEDGILITALPGESHRLYSALSKEDIADIKADAYAKGLMYLSKLKEYLADNAGDFTLYTESPCYKNLIRDDLRGFHKSNNSAGFHF